MIEKSTTKQLLARIRNYYAKDCNLLYTLLPRYDGTGHLITQMSICYHLGCGCLRLRPSFEFCSNFLPDWWADPGTGRLVTAESLMLGFHFQASNRATIVPHLAIITQGG